MTAFLLFVRVLALAYAPVLLASKVVSIDAHVIMGNLRRTPSLGGYFSNLLNNLTVDVQPVRDLTLWIDDQAWRSFHLQTGVAQNLLWWAATCWALWRILSLLLPGSYTGRLRIYAVLFALYPLFAATLPWSIARKHVLATMFTAFATWRFLLVLENPPGRGKNILLSVVAYFLAVFSQPICLLWPAWAGAYAFYRRKLRMASGVLVGSGLVFLTGFWMNFQYYRSSPVFKLFYSGKTDDPFNFGDKLLALGHYAFQLFLPYDQAFSYDLGHWTVMAGLAIFTVVAWGIWKARQRTHLAMWALYAACPLAIVLVSPRSLSDNYLLIPAVGAWIAGVLVMESNPTSVRWVGRLWVPVALVWALFVHQESKYWLDSLTFMGRRDFARRPGCDSATNYSLKSLSLTGMIPPEAKEYLESHDCSRPIKMVGYSDLGYLFFQAHVAYQAKELSHAERVDRLTTMGKLNFFPTLLLALAHYEKGEDELAASAIDGIYRDREQIQWPNYRDHVIATKLYPQCQRVRNLKCLELAEHFLADPDESFL